ncbi:hypothetical protein EAF00_006129 [Botryotinia globosa]|nr:hypothetical protein EAF00_006129 [Botryotinia globosa]
MVMSRVEDYELSAAFFCPQSRAPDEDYLAGLYLFLSQNEHGQILLKETSEIDKVWEIFADAKQDIRKMSQGLELVGILKSWATSGESSQLATVRSGIVALPLLVILQIGQYLRYLEFHGISHTNFIDRLKDTGGAQGYCGGLPSAIAIACAQDEMELVKNTAIVIRVLLGVGAYGEAADDTSGAGSTTLAFRLKYEGQGDDLTRLFPETHVSAITDPRSVSIVGSAKRLEELFVYAQRQGIQVQKMDIRGKVHNPENKDLAAELCHLCHDTSSLNLSDASKLQASVRSNISGERLRSGSLTEEIVTTILASRCNWYMLLNGVAEDLSALKQIGHKFVIFGLNDCVPMSPFHKKRLQATKSEVHSLIQKVRSPSSRIVSLSDTTFLQDAIAIVGASCRLPGANNLEELWELIANGTDCHQEVSKDRFDLYGSYRASQSGNFVNERKFYGNFVDDVRRFDNQFFGINPREAANMDPQQRMLLELSFEALDSSGYLSKHSREIGDKATGDNAGECKMALIGGVNIITGISNFLDLGKAGFLSYIKQCNLFDKFVDGYCHSNGAGLVVLKTIKQALSDNDEILGLIPAIATNQGGLSTSITVPHSAAQQALYRIVIQRSGLQPEQITYVEAHGIGTQAGDPLKMENIRSIFGSPFRLNIVYVGSIKGNIDHCETAVGVVSLIKVLAMLKHGKIPPQANHQQLNSKISNLKSDNLDISRNVLEWNVPFRAALVNSYGAAGSNCALLCCELPKNDLAEKHKSYVKNTSILYPVILSAASQNSLLEQARVLSTFLRQKSNMLDIRDISYTLNEKRQRQKWYVSITSKSTKDLTDQLDSINPLSFGQLQKSSKPIVLCFSGQSDNKVALSETICKTYPAFRFYIDACDKQVQSLGFRSIIPAIFQTQPIDDVITLQCSIFAMQYACGKCWIDAGLKISAIIGHSVGELTALAVSEVLSLSDGIALIASRGHLIHTKWGPEKGAMSVLHCDANDFELISIRLQASFNGKIEIACYNSPTSLVVAGTLAMIEATEELIRTDPMFQNIKSQRVGTSHGFHSALVDPILGELADIAKSLHWNEPKIPLELCTAEPLSSMESYSVTDHARRPVYFSDAVRRLENSLGSSIWLEAGINTPIIAMAKRASGTPEMMTYHAIRTLNDQNAAEAISASILALWISGVSLIHWSYLPTLALDFKQIWLPPYQFEKAPYWRENIDRTIEMQQTSSNNARDPPLQHSPQLITRSAEIPEQPGVAVFLVNTKSQRFSKIVGGHVRGRPLCPASMYMECIVMAIQLLIGEIKGESLIFDKLDFHASLGLYPKGEVVIQLVKAVNAERSWKFTITTSIPTSTKPKQVLHTSGIIALLPDSLSDTFHRLIAGPIEKLEKNANAEKLMSKRAYGLFQLVVDYDHFFRGIKTVKMDEWEAIATISVPEAQPNREESTSWLICDTVTIDTFIQVVGLLMNSSNAVSKEEVMVMVGVEHTVISQACNMRNRKDWRVYAKFCFTQDGQPMGDVFVSSPGGELVAMLCGCRFAKLPISKLEKALDSSNSKAAVNVPRLASTKVSTASSTTGGGLNTPTMFTPATDSNISSLRDLIAEYTGANTSDIPTDTMFAYLGLDSLASFELVGELLAKFELVISSDELLTSNLNDLNERLGGPDLAKILPSQTDFVKHPIPELVESFTHESDDRAIAQQFQKVLQILADISGAKIEDIKENDLLPDLGIDSLSLVDLKQELEESFSVRFEEILLDCTVKDLTTRLNIDRPSGKKPSYTKNVVQNDKVNVPAILEHDVKLDLPNPFRALTLADVHFDDSAKMQGFSNYWSDAAPFQDDLLLAYIVEAFGALGVDLANSPPESSIAQLPHLAQRYDKLVQRLWKILQKHDVVFEDQTGSLKRGNRVIDTRPSSQLVERFRRKFQAYEHETNLISLTGPKLADCLSGTVDPVSIMFGSPSSLKIMENFYAQSPMMSTLTEQLVIFITTLTRGFQAARSLRILEVGAGTGGTTKRLAKALDSSGISVEYTFTDISSSLVAKAKNKFQRYTWIKFATFNLEKEVSSEFRNRFDIIISANCVHATTNRTMSCRRLREALVPNGFIVLSEVTRIIDWYDICFGLLDGWWLAEGNTAYPLQPAEAWMSTFKAAGFGSTSYSQGSMPEANSQQLLVASCNQWEIPASINASSNIDSSRGVSYRQEAIVYKEVTIMIHGGGHMTLSRKAVRPMQTQYLLANGYLPVSIDYRLCPEINLVDGPMTDVYDAYQWSKNVLPQIAAGYGLLVDKGKVVVIGWSTGGQLAMSIAWTAKLAKAVPPTAVLSFYSPVDFESKGQSPKLLDVFWIYTDIFEPNRAWYESSFETTGPKNEYGKYNFCSSTETRMVTPLLKTMIIPCVNSDDTPITNYDSAIGDNTNLGWVRPGDPRSELLLSMFKEGTGLSLLLNGLPRPGAKSLDQPTQAQIIAISPLAQLRKGSYDVPTFIIHGTRDQIAPFADSEKFVVELKKRIITCGFLPLEGVDHIYDLQLKPETREWEEKVEPGYQFLFDVVRSRI